MFKTTTVKITKAKLEDLMSMLKNTTEEVETEEREPSEPVGCCGCGSGWEEEGEDWDWEGAMHCDIQNLQLALSDVNEVLDDADENIRDLSDEMDDMQESSGHLYSKLEKLSIRMDKIHMFLEMLSKETKLRFEENEKVIEDLHEAVSTILTMLAEDTLEGTDEEDEDYRELRRAVRHAPFKRGTPEWKKAFNQVTAVGKPAQRHVDEAPRHRRVIYEDLNLGDLRAAKYGDYDYPPNQGHKVHPNMHGLRPMDYETDVLYNHSDYTEDYIDD